MTSPPSSRRRVPPSPSPDVAPSASLDVPPSRASRVLVITPTYNERDNLRAFVTQVLTAVPRAHVLIVDDASPDGTGDVAEQLASEDARVHVIHRPAKLGLGTAYLEGFRYALAERYDVAFEMDADHSHDPTHFKAFFAALENGADVVSGSRNIQGGGVVGWGFGRHLLSKGGSLYARTILAVPVRDLTTGFKAFTRRALQSMDLAAIRSGKRAALAKPKRK